MLGPITSVMALLWGLIPSTIVRYSIPANTIGIVGTQYHLGSYNALYGDTIQVSLIGLSAFTNSTIFVPWQMTSAQDATCSGGETMGFRTLANVVGKWIAEGQTNDCPYQKTMMLGANVNSNTFQSHSNNSGTIQAYLKGSSSAGISPPNIFGIKSDAKVEWGIVSGAEVGVLMTRVNAAPDTSISCTVPDNLSCETCGYPYHSAPNVDGCGCAVSTTQYASPDRLKLQCYAYCNGEAINGTQAYLDAARSNFDASKGAPRCACSNPSGTIYRPTQTCPRGSDIRDSVGWDTAAIDSPQTIPYDPSLNPGVGSGSDAGIYRNQLDTIIDRLYDINTYTVLSGNTLDSIRRLLEKGVGGGSGSDTGTHRRLDDIMAFMDTSGNSSYDSIRDRMGYLLDSISNDTFDIKPTIDSLMGIINVHVSRGDTAGYDGATLDSMLNFCITMPIQDSTYCFRDTAAWPYTGPWFQWIRRMILVFWGFVCAGIFLGIAHGSKDD